MEDKLKPTPVIHLVDDITLTNDTFVTLASFSSNLTINPVGIASSRLVSNDVIQYIYTINMSIICAVCCLFGIVTNIMNIIVFIILKFNETINIALLGRAISDLFSVISLLWSTICFNPLFMYLDFSYLTIELQQKTGSWTHMIFSRVTAFLTVYIALERCLCIAFPLQIKRMLTPKRVLGIIISIYVIIISSMCQNYTYFNLEWKYVPEMNRTMFGMVYSKDKYIIQTVTYFVTAFYPTAAFISVVICSIILVLKLNARGSWLHIATGGTGKIGSASSELRTIRDQQIVRMVVYLALIFIISFTPSVIFFLAMAVEPRLNIGGRYENLFVLIYSITLTFHAANCSANIFVYYKMSSKYALVFRSLFYCDAQNVK